MAEEQQVTNMETPFNITKEEVLNLAAQKVADEFWDVEEIDERAMRMIRERVEKVIAERVLGKVEEELTKTMDVVMNQVIQPVTIWGDKCGKPTTLRDALAEKAREFWDVKVSDDGKPSDSYSARPRHRVLFEQLVRDEFSKGIRENAETIVAEFKKALLADSTKLVAAHIEKLIPSKRGY